MTDRYAHFEPSDFIKAKEVQEALLQPNTAHTIDKPQADGAVERRFSVIHFSGVRETDLSERKQA